MFVTILSKRWVKIRSLKIPVPVKPPLVTRTWVSIHFSMVQGLSFSRLKKYLRKRNSILLFFIKVKIMKKTNNGFVYIKTNTFCKSNIYIAI